MSVIVIGAGLAGLTAARRIAADDEVIVVERSAKPGGRLATRQIAGAAIDAGAQFFTVRGEEFGRQVDDWLARGIVHVWCHGFYGRADGYPRYVGTRGMDALAADLAAELDVRYNSMAFSVRRRGDGWVVVIDDGTTIDADRIVLTCPIPQAWALLAQSGVELPADLARFDYHRTIALLTVLDGPGSVPDPGGVQFDPSDAASPFGFVGDQFARGVSLVPALTFHASQPWSAEHWDVPPADLVEPLLARAAPWVGAAEVLHAEVVKWRFAGPVSAWPDACWTNDDGSIVIAGDSFAGAKVEGAFNSGLAAAAAVVNPPSSP